MNLDLLRNIRFEYVLLRYPSESEPWRVIVTEEVNVWLVWDTSLYKADNERESMIAAIHQHRDDAIRDAVRYAEGRLELLRHEWNIRQRQNGDETV